MAEKEIGIVSTYFKNVFVAAIKLSDKLKVGDVIHILGNTTDFKEEVREIQVSHNKVNEARKGDHIGIKVKDRVRPNDKIFLVR